MLHNYSMDYSFNQFSSYASEGIGKALKTYLLGEDTPPVFVCVGSDLVIGDTLAPLVGTMMQERCARAFVYGSLAHTVTAKEIARVPAFLDRINPRGKRIVIDAAVGEKNELGLIKIKQGALRPGSGIGKTLAPVGDISVLGIVAERSVLGYSLEDLTRLKLVYSMAEKIAEGICYALNLLNFGTF
ncbi:MAG: spore protease YyaC [Christensenellaceae bacterium]